MAISDVYKLTLTSELPSGIAINVFHYLWASGTYTGSGNPSVSLNTAFFLTVLPTIEGITHTDTTFYEQSVVCYRTPTDFAQSGFFITGTRGGEAMPVFVAWSFRTPQPYPGQRRGYKRIGMIAENDVVDGFASPSAVPLLATCAAAMSQNLTFEGVTWTPVVATGVKVLGAQPTYFANGAYVANTPETTTQSTRKR